MGSEGRRFAFGIALSALCVALILPLLATASPYDDPCRGVFVSDPALRPSPRVKGVKVAGLTVNILLPPGYSESRRRYPVLYLLHGFTQSQNSWLAKSDIERFSGSLPRAQHAIVVMPEGHFSGLDFDWRNRRELWESLYTARLIPYVDANFRTIGDRSHRAIAGLSGGGWSAFHLTARRPDLFVSAASFSGSLEFFNYRSPAGDLAIYPLEQGDSSVCHGWSASDEGMLGDPVMHNVWRRSISPSELIANLDQTALYIASGNGEPCDPEDTNEIITGGPLVELERPWEEQALDVESKLRAAHIAHVARFYPCGIHTWRYWERDLHEYWPLMTRAFGTPPPASFDYRRIDSRFSMWNWIFQADPKRATEFLHVSGASRRGLTLTGSGSTTVTTAGYFHPGQRVRLKGAVETITRADRRGRITFHVDLGPAHKFEQDTLMARALEAAGGYWMDRKVTCEPVR